ncbi:hypothetical protein [Pseudoxanthomonas mexicana]|jgi:hypothetical protein|nr:hypothetical protein [Pseudoxanthomonas mexicana]
MTLRGLTPMLRTPDLPETFSYDMGEFAIYDNNGHLLQFGTPVR